MTSYHYDTLPLSDGIHHFDAIFYRPKDQVLQKIILYFHGGGLIFGQKEDLPTPFLEQFAAHGIGILAVDYPLAPAHSLEEIIQQTRQIAECFLDFLHEHQLKIPYYIFGRSAGGYLALHAGLHLIHNSNHLPAGMILLYSYFNLTDAAFLMPNRYYQQFPMLDAGASQRLIQKAMRTQLTAQEAFLIYLNARQKGKWMDILTKEASHLKKFSLTKEEIKTLPPLFIASATHDTDVPSRQSRQLANFHPNATLLMIEEKGHDIDRTFIETHGMRIYKAMIHWMELHN
ncbi:alpha/beta hydrolase [Allofustis seminis]|uniref:alpha/beta hydrolase n=1 Tax=Allofustis seminis TaxID=166939 RepID=UPI00035D7871|nr:alpha/beta hydrolase [Allofustis seminis]